MSGSNSGEMVLYTSVAYPGFQRGGCLRSGPIRKGGGGGAVHFRSDIRKVGGWGQFAAGGGGAIHFRSDTKSGGGPIPLFGTKKILYH